MGAGLADAVKPLTLATNVEDESLGFSATASGPEFELCHHVLRVCAREMDSIRVCGWPYYKLLGRRAKMTEHETFNHWFNLAKAALNNTDVEPMFASTLVMDGKVAVMERRATSDNSPDVTSLFERWACRNLENFNRPCGGDWKDGIDDSTQYADLITSKQASARLTCSLACKFRGVPLACACLVSQK
jgi:hypothetical protein